MQGISKELFKDKYTEEIGEMMYALGKWVYIMDAIDDLEEDSKKSRYNPFIAKYGKCENKKEYINKNKKELEFICNSTYNDLADAYDAMDVKVAEGVLSNIIYKGIPMQIGKLLKGEEKCHTTRL